MSCGLPAQSTTLVLAKLCAAHATGGHTKLIAARVLWPPRLGNVGHSWCLGVGHAWNT